MNPQILTLKQILNPIFIVLFVFININSSSLAEPIVATNHSSKQKVLILNSYNEGYKWTDNELRGIKSVFNNYPNVVLHIEYMDSKRISNPYFWQQLKELYKIKYSDFHFDAIITTDDDALDFLVKYREELFYQVPVIFCGVNNFNQSKLENFNLYTGVNEQADFSSNFQLIKLLHPKAKKLYIINDNLTTGKSLKNSFLASIKEQSPDLKVQFLEELSFSKLKQKLSNLSSDSVVFYLSFFRDINGLIYTPLEVLPQLSKISTVPIYGSTDYMLGFGIIGGMLKNSFYQGETAANLSIKVLEGENINNLPVMLNSPNQYMFDYKELMRFNIKLSQLPANSQLINEPETFLYKYKNIGLVIVITFIVLIALLLLLLSILYKKNHRNKLFRTRKSDFINNDKEVSSRASLQKVIDIQVSNIPQHFTSFGQTNQIDLYAYLQPGINPNVDFYDFFSMDNNKLFFVVGTSHGKAVKSALFMIKAKEYIRSLAHPGLNAGNVLTEVNRKLSNKNKHQQYVNLLLAIIDKKNNQLNYSSAGANKLILFNSNGQAIKPTIKNTAGLAVRQDTSYISMEMPINKFPFILLYSNGIIDIVNEKKQLYGENRLMISLNKACQQAEVNAQSISRYLINDINIFSATHTQIDDLCLMVIKNELPLTT